MKEELSELEWLMRAVDGREVGLDGIVRFGKWFVSESYIIYPSNDFRIDSMPIYIKSIDTEGDFESQYENLQKHLIKKGYLTKESESDFEKAFVYVWLISDMPNKTSLPSYYDIEEIKKSAIICTRDDNEIVFTLERPESYFSFEILGDMDDYSLMHYPGVLHLYLKHELEDPNLESVTFLFKDKNNKSLWSNPTAIRSIIDTGYSPLSSFKNYRVVDSHIYDYGFTAFLLNYFANKLHQKALLDSTNPCEYMSGIHNEKEFWEDICFPNAPVMVDFREYYRLDNINNILPRDTIFEEYLSFLKNEKITQLKQDPDFDILNCAENTWWPYTYKQEMKYWEEFKKDWYDDCFGEEDQLVIDQYIINFLNYLNLKFNLGNEFLELPHISYDFDGERMVSRKYTTKSDVTPQDIKQPTSPSTINHFYGTHITINEFQENSNCTIVTSKDNTCVEQKDEKIEAFPLFTKKAKEEGKTEILYKALQQAAKQTAQVLIDELNKQADEGYLSFSRLKTPKLYAIIQEHFEVNYSYDNFRKYRN